MEKIYALLQLGLRRVVSKISIEDLLQNRQDIINQILADTEKETADLGVRLLKLEIKDLILSGDIKKGFIQIMTAKQEGLAALEKARGEMASLRSLANAAKMIEP